MDRKCAATHPIGGRRRGATGRTGSTRRKGSVGVWIRPEAGVRSAGGRPEEGVRSARGFGANGNPASGRIRPEGGVTPPGGSTGSGGVGVGRVRPEEGVPPPRAVRVRLRLRPGPHRRRQSPPGSPDGPAVVGGARSGRITAPDAGSAVRRVIPGRIRGRRSGTDAQPGITVDYKLECEIL